MKPLKVIFSPDKRIVSFAMRQCLSAKKTVDIVVYLIGSKRVANALVKAHEKGVTIRMVIDGKVARSRYLKDDFLKGKGIEVRTIRVRGGSMHSKFILIDGKKLIAGSANLTNDADSKNHEFILVSEDPKMVGAFSVKFEELWNEGENRPPGRQRENPVE